ncbi:MAG: carboxypeptidase regulatory-like domain-containing protein [Candidatus Ozemobacteraceae bacterium]
MKYVSALCCWTFLMIIISSVAGCHQDGYGNFGGSITPIDGSEEIGIISGSATVSILDPALRDVVKNSLTSVWLQENFATASDTDGNGSFIFKGVSFGNIHRVVARFRFRDNAGKITTYKARSAELSVTIEKPVLRDVNLNLQLANNTVSGILRDTQENPISFATLILWGEPFLTDEFGRFDAPLLPPSAATGTVVETITVKVPGFSEYLFKTTLGLPETTFVEVTAPRDNEQNKPPCILLFRDPSEGAVSAGGKTTLWAVFFDHDSSSADLKARNWDISDGTGASSSTSLPTSLKDAVDQFTAGISADKIGVEALLWTAPYEEGYQAITVRVRDSAGAEGGVTLKVPVANPLAPLPPMSVNRPPVPTVVATGTLPSGLSVALEALPNDPDGNFGMVFAWSVKPAEGTFSTTRAGRTVWTAPLATGTYEFTCIVTDPAGASGKGIHNLVVYAAEATAPQSPNQPPAPKIVSRRIVTVGRELSLKAISNDPDGDMGLTYAWSANSVGGSFSTKSSATATWTAPLTPGPYVLWCVVSDGHVTATAMQQVTVITDTPVTSPHRISGYVRDNTSDAPIIGALVLVSGANRYAITDEQGYFQFLDVEAGTYVIIVTRDGYLGKTFTGIVVPAS